MYFTVLATADVGLWISQTMIQAVISMLYMGYSVFILQFRNYCKALTSPIFQSALLQTRLKNLHELEDGAASLESLQTTTRRYFLSLFLPEPQRMKSKVFALACERENGELFHMITQAKISFPVCAVTGGISGPLFVLLY